MSAKLRDDIDRRAKSIGLNRSQYLAQLAKRDIAAGGNLVLQESPTDAPTPAASAAPKFMPERPVAEVFEQLKPGKKAPKAKAANA